MDEIVRVDYPWVNDAIQPLRNLTVPYPASDSWIMGDRKNR